jgi:hypothetical protein
LSHQALRNAYAAVSAGADASCGGLSNGSETPGLGSAWARAAAMASASDVAMCRVPETSCSVDCPGNSREPPNIAEL